MNKSLVILAALLASVGSASAQKLVIKGSDTLGAKLVPTLAEEYKAANPGVSFEIAAEGSTTGITAITDGTAAIGMSSRRAKATEMSGAAAKGVNLKPIIVCYDGMAVIVNEKNPLTTLTKKQVEQVFTGDVSDWSAIGGTAGAFSIYTRNTSSGTYSDWKDLAMKKRDYAPSSQKMAGNEQIAAEVGKNVNGIGYVGVAYIHAPGIKVVSIEGAMPTKDEILKKTYPYARPNFYYTNGEPSGEAAKFIAFTHSDAGQKIVEKVGFIPVK
jgi:phosphate transport system substrate-binding protein